jgi:hypothetical protein
MECYNNIQNSTYFEPYWNLQIFKKADAASNQYYLTVGSNSYSEASGTLEN